MSQKEINSSKSKGSLIEWGFGDLTVGDVKDKPAFIAVKLLLGLSLVGIGIHLINEARHFKG